MSRIIAQILSSFRDFIAISRRSLDTRIISLICSRALETFKISRTVAGRGGIYARFSRLIEIFINAVTNKRPGKKFADKLV